MNKYLKSFLHRGLIFGGFGPMVVGIVYLVLSLSIDGFSLSGGQICLAIFSSYVLAFIQAGASVLNQIEDWPIAKSLAIHFSLLFVCYSLCYVINSWIPFEPMVLVIFSAVFIVTYFIIWGIVYLAVKNTAKSLNEGLS